MMAGSRQGGADDATGPGAAGRYRAELDRLAENRRIWDRKPALRRVYGDFHRRLLEPSHPGRLLEIGAGTGHLGRSAGRVVSLDVLCSSSIDVNGDAHRLPFRDASFDGIVLLDTLHHLERPARFLREAARVLCPGGTIAMIEPGMTPLSRLFYGAFHEEPVDMSADPWVEGPLDAGRRPFDSNQAIPTLMFLGPEAARRLAVAEPSLVIRERRWLSLWAYPLSGGFRPWRLIPEPLVGPLLATGEGAAAVDRLPGGVSSARRAGAGTRFRRGAAEPMTVEESDDPN